MRILLDECVPRRLKRHFHAHGDVLTVGDAGLASYSNGQLLRRISGEYDVFITVDKSIQYQQNLAAYDVAVVLLRVRSNDIVAIEPLLPSLFARWAEIRKRSLIVVE